MLCDPSVGRALVIRGDPALQAYPLPLALGLRVTTWQNGALMHSALPVKTGAVDYIDGGTPLALADTLLAKHR